MSNKNTYSNFLAEWKNGNTTCIATVRHFLTQIKNNEHLNCFLEVYADEALAQAQIIDEKLKNNTAGKLAGMVIGIKDVLCYKAHKVSAASKILENYTSIYSATAVQHLINEDAIIIGRTNCDEFAMGSSNENSAYGKVLNAANTNCVPGGSSGGSAVAVQAGLCHTSLGTDTGGSVRQPASFCGIVGIKPTYGRISRYGVIAYASSFDQIGVFSHSVDDAALVLEAISGKDSMDATSSSYEVPAYSKIIGEFNLDQISFAYLSSTINNDGLDSEIKSATLSLFDQLKQYNATVNGYNFDKLNYLIPTYYVLTTAEASSNLARYDGVHYGYRSPNATDLESVYKLSRSEAFGAEVQRRIMLGTFVLSEGYYDAYYSKAQKVRQALVNEINEILANNDFLICPTTPTPAFQFNAKKDPIAMYLNDIYTVLANLVGMPAISIPLGVHSNGMPYGIQLMSKKFDEAKLLAVAKCISKQLINSN